MDGRIRLARRINGLEHDIKAAIACMNGYLRVADPNSATVLSYYIVQSPFLPIGRGQRPQAGGAHAKIAELCEKAGMEIMEDPKSWGINWESLTQERLTHLARLLERETQALQHNAHDGELHEKAKRLVGVLNRKMAEVPGEERPYFAAYFVQQSRQLHLLRGGAMAQDQLHYGRREDHEVWEKAGAFARLFDNEVSGLLDGEKPLIWKYMCQESHALENLPKPQQGRVGGGGWGHEH